MPNVEQDKKLKKAPVCCYLHMVCFQNASGGSAHMRLQAM